MTRAIRKTKESEELLRQLLSLPADLSALDRLLKEKHYCSEDVTRAGFDYAEKCFSDFVDHQCDHAEEFLYAEAKRIPGLLSADMPEVFGLLLKYGLDPNAVCDGESVMHAVAYIYNGYVAADTLSLFVKHGGDPCLMVDGECLLDQIGFDVIYGVCGQGNRGLFDAKVHCWFVLLGSSDDRRNGKELVTVFNRWPYECALGDFKISDLKDHRDYTFGITNTPGRGSDWTLHIFDKRTLWEVARLQCPGRPQY